MVKGVGVDCGTLLYLVYGTQFSLRTYPKGYAVDWSLHRDEELYLDFIKQYLRETSTPEPADIVLFRIGRCYSHGTILTERGSVIHAWGSRRDGRVMESSISFFRNRARKVFKVVKE
jgi:cell wall-associated NlpC family hydrolase